MLAFQSAPKKLLDQSKETILITALEKIHIQENCKCYLNRKYYLNTFS